MSTTLRPPDVARPSRVTPDTETKSSRQTKRIVSSGRRRAEIMIAALSLSVLSGTVLWIWYFLVARDLWRLGRGVPAVTTT